MSIYERLLDFDELVERNPVTPIFLNDLSTDTEEAREKISNLLTTQYRGDRVSMIPRCQCGFLFSKSLENDICPRCNTIVQSSVEGDIVSTVWFRTPTDIVSLMSPIVYTMLCNRFTKQGWSIIRWFTDTDYAPQVKMQKFMMQVMDAGFERGWNNFVTNFDQIFQFLMTLKDFQVGIGEIDYLYYLYVKHREKFFCNYMPLPSSTLQVIEKTPFGNYRSSSTDKAEKFLSIMMSIEGSIRQLRPRAKENRIARLYDAIMNYQKDYIANDIAPKQGQIRRNIIATNTIMSFRTVISSITKPSDYEMIEVPWFVGLMTYRPMLINKLDRKGFTINKAVDLLLSHVGTWHPLLDRLLDELVEEAPNGELWTMYQRNPSLKQGAAQLGKTKFKKNPGDKTTGIPLWTMKAPNADVDGDELNFMSPIDGLMVDQSQFFRSHYNAFHMGKPGRMAGNIYVSKPIAGSMSRFYENP